MAVHLARYLNVPPARLPGEGGDRLDDLPESAEEIRAAFLEHSIANGRSTQSHDWLRAISRLATRRTR